MHQLYRDHQPCDPVGAHLAPEQEIHHEHQHQKHLDAEADDGRQHIRNRRGQPGEIHLAKDIGIGGEGIGIVGQACGEIRPDSVAAQVEQQRGDAICLDARDAAEDEGLHDGAEQGRQEDPGRAKDGLLVGHHEVPLGEQADQVPVLPDLFQVQVVPVVFG